MQHLLKRFGLKFTKLLAPCLTGAAMGLGGAASVHSQPVVTQLASPHEAIFMNKAADREAWLLERAKKEGGLTLYTSLSPTESGPLMAEFEKKYGLKVTVWRGLSDGVVQRVVNESRAKRHVVDVVETNGPEMEMLAREKVLSEFHSPHIADLPQGMIPKHRQWMPDRVNFFVVAFNTQKVKREDLPKHYEGFTEPKWKGRIAIESTDAEWMGGLVNALGEPRGMAFFKKLSEQKPDVRKGHILLAQMVAAGETDVGLTIYNANAQSLKQRGAPIDWLPIEPTLARPQGVGVARLAAHPHAAALFADFILSPDAQALLNSMGRPPANQKVKSNLNNFTYVLTDPGVVVDEAEKWNQHWTRLFLSK
jgi:iron(III) transport system substrate-binding protein